MFIFRKIWRALFSWNTRFEIRPFALLQTNYFRKTLHFRYLRRLWARLYHPWGKFSICILSQMKREHIPINVWCFSLRDSSDEDCAFDELKTFLLVWKFLSSSLNEFLQSKINHVPSKISLALLQLLMNNQVQFICLRYCVPPDFVVQINNFFNLVLFSAVIHKRRGKELISKRIKYNLDSSS